MSALEKTVAQERTDQPVLELEECGKSYGNVHALRGVNIKVRQGEVTCVLGDNGAGKSTLIKIVAGLHDYTEGTMKIDGIVRSFNSPRVAQQLGIATVYQDLALAPLMAVWRNFFLGNEVRKGLFLDTDHMKKVCWRGAHQDGHRHPRPRPTGRQPLRRPAAGHRDRPCGLLRCPRHHPRRAHCGPRRQAVRRRAEVHRQGARRGPRGHLHHAQPAPRLSRGQPLHHPQARPGRARRAPRRADPRAAHR